MKWLRIILLSIVIIFTSFQQEPQPPQNEYFIGNWLYFSDSGFLLIEIEEINKINLFEYIDREVDVGENDPNMKHYYYKSQGWIKDHNEYGLSIQTDRYRYDFLFRNDTLILFDELGEGWKLIKLNSE